MNGDYYLQPGLSQSGMKDLAVSPLRYWSKWIDPNRIRESPTPAMELGTAFHCLVLEPDQFPLRYARQLKADDIEDCLVTMDDLRGFLNAREIKPKGTRRADVIAQIQAVAPDAPIFDVLSEIHAHQHEGKTILSADFWALCHGMAAAINEEPRVREILAVGKSEAEYTVKDPATGVILKAKMDWITDELIVDLKSFSQTRGKSIDKTVGDAVWYEAYYRQAYFYSLIRSIAEGKKGTRYDVVLAFVESEPPFETRLRTLFPTGGGNVNMYWERARIETRDLIDLYAECLQTFGTDKPWRYAQELTPLSDEDLPQQAY